MSKIIQSMPMPLAAGTLLVGAMLFGASVTYSYGQLSSVVYANGCVGDICDAEDPDDCGTECHCNDSEQKCKANIED